MGSILGERHEAKWYNSQVAELLRSRVGMIMRTSNFATIPHHLAYPSDVQFSYSTRRSEFTFHRHGERDLSNPEGSSPAKSRKLHFSFQPTRPAPARYRRPYADRKKRIPSYISQSDIPRKAARSARHILDVRNLLLFRDGLLSVYHVEVSFLSSPNQRHPLVCR